MSVVDALVMKSQYYPSRSEIRAHNSENPNYHPVNPERFRYAKESINLFDVPERALNFVRNKTEDAQIEYSIVLGGKILENGDLSLTDYCFSRGLRNSANYSTKQRSFASKFISKSHGIVVYGHTHTSLIKEYNYFSVSDLKFIIKMALETCSNAYGILITKDRTFAIKYDYNELEFFRVKMYNEYHREL